MKRILSLFLVIIIAITAFTGCKKKQPTDEELITERINAFLNAYNTGDMDTVLYCLDAKTRNTFQAMLNLLGGLAGSAAGFDIDLSDLFSLGVSTSSGEFMDLEITDINIIDSSNAIATTVMNLTGVGNQTIYFIMLYENEGWYICNMSDKKPTTITPDQGNTNVAGVLTTSRSEFLDDVACVYYTENEMKYTGLINRSGEIFYSYDESLGVSNYTFIGNGKTALTNYNDWQELLYIVDEKGNVTKRFEEGLRLLASGDGLALVYKREETISEIKHLYGVVNSFGEWVRPLTDLGYYPQSGWDYSHYYLGDGIFAIMVQSWAGSGGDDFIFLNSDTGTMFYISRLRNQLSKFVNGVTFVYGAHDWSYITNPYYTSTETRGLDAPKYYLLYNDGSYEEYNMDGKDFRGYSNGYLYYTKDGDGNMYIEDIASSDKRTFTYSAYSESMIKSIEFNGEYALVTIRGANGNLYFTLIDKNGNQQFDPIETTSYSNWTGKHYIKYSDNTVVFQNTDDEWCIADIFGNIIVTDNSLISAFSNGIAVAQWQGTYIYINTKNEQILQTITLP